MSARHPARGAALSSFVILLGVYVATLAPDVTFWDSGELIAAAHSLGIPHPPGAPLYILLGNVVMKAFAFMGTAAALNFLSAIATAAACALGGAFIAAETRSATYGVAAALCAGSSFTVWRNATEAEVYAPALLCAVLMLWGAVQVSRTQESRWVLFTAYLMGLAASLHLTALVAAPAAIVIAGYGDERFAWNRAFVLCAAALIAVGAGKGSLPLAGAGVLIAAGSVFMRGGMPSGVRRRVAMLGPGAAAVALLGASCLLFTLVRAQHDPAINQGDPDSVAALLQVLRRDQYDVAPLWPRQAPVWIQLGNYFQYLDWQFGQGLARDVMPSVPRTLACITFVALAAFGVRYIASRDRRMSRAAYVMFVAASLGVVVYLNLKAGPSIGYGVLPDSAPHEARERDYFFLLSFWTLGLLAGTGAAAFLSRVSRAPAAAGIAVAALPLLLNFSAANRRREPDASTPARFAHALLDPLPDSAVILLAGDNDSYPIWYLQQVHSVRRDVVPITVPMLGAGWYRRELASRYSLLSKTDTAWKGLGGILREIADSAGMQRRPIASAIGLRGAERSLIGESWKFIGFQFVYAGDDAEGGTAVDSALVRRFSRLGAAPHHVRLHSSTESMQDYVTMLMSCAAIALGEERGAKVRTRCAEAGVEAGVGAGREKREGKE